MDDEFTRVRLHDCLESEFPGEWGDPPKCGGNVSVLRSTDIDSAGHVNLATGARRTVPESKLVAKRLKPGDILLEASGGGPGKPVGRVALFPPGTVDAYVCSNFFRTLRPNPTRVDSPYLAWRLQHAYLQPSIWAFQQQTTGIINLKHRDYFAITLELPPLPEQRLIAEILDTVDLAIRKTEAMIAKLGQVKQGLLHDLLTRGIDDNGQLRDPDRHPEQFKDSPLGRIPKGWEAAPLGTVARLQGGFAFPSTLFGSGPVPIVRMSNLRNGQLDLRDAVGVSHSIAKSQSTFALATGDLLLGMSGSLENTAIVQTRDLPASLNQRVGRFLLSDPERLRYRLLDLYVASHFYHRQLGREAVGAAQLNISSGQVEATIVPLPKLPEQDRVLTVWQGFEARQRHERLALKKLRLLKQGLMDDLLTGRVRVTNLLQEAAT